MSVPTDKRRPPFWTLIAVLMAGQTFGTMATLTLPAVAPKVAQTYGVHSSVIGYQISLLAGFMVISLVLGGNLATRWGAARTVQVGLSMLTLGLVIATLPHIGFFFLSAITLGLGYGTITPSSSHLLMRFTPPDRRNIIFSFKQTGVPLGGVGAAMIAPALTVAFGWQTAVLVNAAELAILILVIQRGRDSWDDDRNPSVKLVSNPTAGMSGVWKNVPLRMLSLSGALLVMVQVSITTFTVVLFVEEMHLSLIEAGYVLTASQVGGVFGRVFWGWLADYTRRCIAVLAVLSAVMCVSALACYTLTPSWPVAGSAALFFVFGSTATGWNGAFLAEVARLAPRDSISRTTGGSLFFVNFGKMLGPMVLTAGYMLTHSYVSAFALLSLAAAASLVCLLRATSLVVPAAAGQRA